MKNLFTSFLLLISFSATSQMGIHAGVNYSWFGHGDKTFTGADLKQTGFRGGFNYHMPFYKSRVFLEPEINYVHLGAKNPKENDRKFNTYHVQVAAMVGLKFGSMFIQAGPAYNRLVYARNSHFTGDVYGWRVGKWKYYEPNIFAGIAAIGYDFIGVKGKITYMHGFTKVRPEVNGVPSYNDYKMKGNQDRAISLEMYVPFTTFKK